MLGVFKMLTMIPAVDSAKKTYTVNQYNPPSSGDISGNNNIAKGKALFMGKCASCHSIFKNSTGPSLIGFEERGPWTDRKSIYAWIRNPSAFMKINKYARDLRDQYGGTMMTAFPDITDAEIDAICAYINGYGQLQKSMPTAL
jgi:cytochrome c2